jgi:hypothetical protein
MIRSVGGFILSFVAGLSILTAPVLVLFVVVAASNISLAADPSVDDVTIIGFENVPGCSGPVWDGPVKASNNSTEYDYKVIISARTENNSEKNDLSVIVTISDNKLVKETRVLPKNCQPVDHCT